MIGISNLYVGTLTDDPLRESTATGAPMARLTLRCPAAGTGEEVALAVTATAQLADAVLRDLRRGDDVLVVGGLAAGPTDHRGGDSATMCVRASHIALDLTSGGWRRDASPALTGASAVAAYHPEYQW